MQVNELSVTLLVLLILALAATALLFVLDYLRLDAFLKVTARRAEATQVQPAVTPAQPTLPSLTRS